MKIPSAFPSSSSLLISSTTLLCITALLPLYGQPFRPNAKSDGQSRVVALLDGYVQTRFEQDEGKFGLRRLPEPVNGHGPVYYKLQATNDREKEILHAVNSSPYEYLVEFLHCTHFPGHMRSGARLRDDGARLKVDVPTHLTLIAARSATASFEPYAFSKARDEFQKTTEAPMEKAAAAVLPRLKRGDAVDTTVGGWHLALRPVRASKAACLNCHVGAKPGDTLGVMAYAVRPAGKPVSRQPAKTIHPAL